LTRLINQEGEGDIERERAQTCVIRSTKRCYRLTEHCPESLSTYCACPTLLSVGATVASSSMGWSCGRRRGLQPSMPRPGGRRCPRRQRRRRALAGWRLAASIRVSLPCRSPSTASLTRCPPAAPASCAARPPPQPPARRPPVAFAARAARATRPRSVTRSRSSSARRWPGGG
jgi:hypothetical protein